jgi:hypothetical protein
MSLVEYRRHKNDPLPAGVVEKINIDNNEIGVYAEITICGDRDRQVLRVEFDQIEIQEALIGFCHLRRIPIARKSEKKICLDRSGITLIATLNLNNF